MVIAMDARELVLYTHPMSRGRIARWMLEETGMPYRVELLDYGTTMKAPAYLAINPMGKVPALTHGDAVVTEVAAIGLYLGDLAPGLAPPVGTPGRAAYYRWICFMGPFEQAMMARHAGSQHSPGSAGFGALDDTVDVLDAAIGERDFLVGESFTMADLVVAAYIGFYLQFKMLDPRPNLFRYARLHAGRPAAQRAQAIDDALIAQANAAAGDA